MKYDPIKRILIEKNNDIKTFDSPDVSYRDLEEFLRIGNMAKEVKNKIIKVNSSQDKILDDDRLTYEEKQKKLKELNPELDNIVKDIDQVIHVVTEFKSKVNKKY